MSDSSRFSSKTGARIISLEGLSAEQIREHRGIQQAAEILRNDGLVAFPTETVYGLGANALSLEAVAAIYRAKDRPGDNPSIVHIAALSDLGKVAPIEDERIFDLLEQFWPGPLTVILPAGDSPIAAVSFSGLRTVAVRMPDHPVALELIKRTGLPIAAPSANRSGRPSPTSASHVAAELGSAIPLILDGGRCQVGLESTVLDLSGEAPTIVRPGRIGVAELAEKMGTEVLLPETSSSPRSPGTRYAHYQPSVPVVSFFNWQQNTPTSLAPLLEHLGLLARLELSDLAFIGPDPRDIEVGAIRLRLSDGELAHHLYSDLWELERLGPRLIVIYAQRPSTAVQDRLRRCSRCVIDVSGETSSLGAEAANTILASLGL